MGFYLKHTKRHFVDFLNFIFILLFVYAAVSKLVDYETFESQLGQSPLLSAFAGWVAPAVIIIELLIALLLIFERTRLFAMFGFYSMMVLFTTYIIIILNFTDFIPCSCGGVLEQLGWTEHLIFNIGFILLGIWGIFLVNAKPHPQPPLLKRERERGE